MKRILLVEDDATIAMGLEYSLAQEGYEIVVCPTVRAALDALAVPAFATPGFATPGFATLGFATPGFDLAILDLSLPDGSGFDICRAIKAQGDLPVLFLTARDDEVSVVMGLDMGGDDYVTKPFRVRELLSRIKTILRRSGGNGSGNNGGEKNGAYGDELSLGPLTIFVKQAKVAKNGCDIPLTALEYRLLLTFAQHEGQVLSRNQLLEGIWDVAGDFVNDNTLTVYIKRLREKIEDDPQTPAIIHTVRGLGYKAGDAP